VLSRQKHNDLRLGDNTMIGALLVTQCKMKMPPQPTKFGSVSPNRVDTQEEARSSTMQANREDDDDVLDQDAGAKSIQKLMCSYRIGHKDDGENVFLYARDA